MNTKHSIFKKFNKFLTSVVAILLIISLLPTTVFADSIGAGLDPNGSQGNTNIGGPSNGKSEVGTHKSTSSKWIGYRVYMVDQDRNVLSDSSVGYYVTDIVCNNMNPTLSEGDNYGTTLRVNNNNVDLTKSEMKIKALNTINSISGIAGQMPAPTVAANGYESPNGDAFKSWMTLENNSVGADGKKYGSNINWLVAVLWGQTALDEYTSHQDYYVVVESVYQCYLWTPYTDTSTYTYTTVQDAPIYNTEHLYYYKGTNTGGCVPGVSEHQIDICDGDNCSYSHNTCLRCSKEIKFTWIDLAKMLLSYGFSRSDYPKQVIVGYATHDEIVHKYDHYCASCPDNFCGVKLKEENEKTYISECTNDAYWDTWYGWMQFNADSTKNNGLVPYTWYLGPMTTSTGYLALAGNSLLLEKNNDTLGLNADSAKDSNGKTLAVVDANKYGYGIHLYRSGDHNGGDPIHTKNPVDPTPSNPNDPITPEEPKKVTPPDEPFDNTGKSTIIKVYGNIYKDGSTTYHIDNVFTYSETNTTDWVVIEDESTYKLQQWVVSGGTPDTNYTATQWLDGFDKSTLFTNSSSGYKLTYTEDEQFKIGEGNTIYLLYLKSLPPLETSDKPIPDTPDPNDTYPEDPSSDRNNQDNPDKKGSFNIIKVYATLDEYNGKVISSDTYPQQSTTPFIKIEDTPESSSWTLAQWKVTNKFNSSITAENWCGEATTQSQLSKFYLNHFYDISTTSTNTSKFGTVYETGTTPCTKYISNGTTLYLLFVKTNGDF